MAGCARPIDTTVPLIINNNPTYLPCLLSADFVQAFTGKLADLLVEQHQMEVSTGTACSTTPIAIASHDTSAGEGYA
jgi:hypothetical protein